MSVFIHQRVSRIVKGSSKLSYLRPLNDCYVLQNPIFITLVQMNAASQFLTAYKEDCTTHQYGRR